MFCMHFLVEAIVELCESKHYDLNSHFDTEVPLIIPSIYSISFMSAFYNVTRKKLNAKDGTFL